jgi:hypothetical protein
MKRLAVSHGVPADAMDTSDTILSTPNGSIIIDRKVEKFTEKDYGRMKYKFIPDHKPEALNTMRLGVEYKEWGNQIKEWEDYLRECLGYQISGERRPKEDVEKIEAEIRLLRAVAGYSLIRGNPEQLVFMLQGTPGSGRSTIAQVLCGVMGTYAMVGRRDLVVSTESDRIKADAGMCCIKHAVFVDELKPSDVIDTGHLGSLTNFRLLVEVKHQNPYERLNNMVIWIISNFENKFDNQNGAIKRRLIVLRFYRPEPKVYDIDMAERFIRDMGPGILQWCLLGLQAVLQCGGLRELVPKHIKEDTESLLRNQDPLRTLIDTCLPKPATGEGTPAFLQEVYMDAKVWYESRGEDVPFRSSRKFANMLRERRIDVHVSHGESKIFGRVYLKPKVVAAMQTAKDLRDADPDKELFSAFAVRSRIVDFLQTCKGEASTDAIKLSVGDPDTVDRMLMVLKQTGEVMEVRDGVWVLSIN